MPQWYKTTTRHTLSISSPWINALSDDKIYTKLANAYITIWVQYDSTLDDSENNRP